MMAEERKEMVSYNFTWFNYVYFIGIPRETFVIKKQIDK